MTWALEKTEASHLHSRMLERILCLMLWAKAKNPHLIVAIENPIGFLSKMPLMKRVEEELRLHCTTVDYSALGCKDKKITHIWTNVSPSTALELLCFTLPEIGF
jgi:hypothetical protein